MSLNYNNYLRWTGLFEEEPFTISSGALTSTMFANQDYIDITPLSVCSASLGIDSRSFKIQDILNFTGGVFGSTITLTEMCTWDSDTSTLRVFRPTDLTVTDFKILFTFKDFIGHESNTVYIQIILAAIVVSWVEYPPSAECVLDIFGVNNGFLKWTQLYLINSGSLAPIIPLQLKDNSPSDPDYISPITDLTTCPVPSGGTYANLRISNFSKNGANPPADFIVITKVTLACSSCGTGGSPLLQTFDVNIQPGETRVFNIPAIAWDTGLTLNYNVNPGGDMDLTPNPVHWKSNTLGAVDNFPTGGLHPVTNTGIYGNFAITVPVTYGITIFCQ